MVDKVGEPEVTLTTRVAPLALLPSSLALMSLGKMRFVKSQWPMWFVAKCISMPSELIVRSGRPPTPALLMRMLRCGTSVQERNSAAAARTAFWLDRSICRVRQFTSGYSALRASTHSCNLAGLRPVRMRWAGDWEACTVFSSGAFDHGGEVSARWLTRACAVEKPIPFKFTPVTITDLPRMPSAKAWATSLPSVFALYSG